PLHPEADKGIDVEESAVDKVLFCRSPVRKPEVLAFEKLVQPISVSVQFLDFRVNCVRDMRHLSEAIVQQPLNDCLVTVSPGQTDGLRHRCRGKEIETIREERKII